MGIQVYPDFTYIFNGFTVGPKGFQAFFSCQNASRLNTISFFIKLGPAESHRLVLDPRCPVPS